MKRSELKKSTKPLKRSPLKRKPKKPSERKYGDFTHKRYNTKKDYVKALQNKAERLWKEAGKLLHGNECEVKKNYPEINTTHSDIIQGEHCFSRAIKQLRFDINNHSSACGNCNLQKSLKNEKIMRAIDEIVKRRNPVWFEEAIKIMLSCEAENNYGQVWWLEDRVKELEDKLLQLQGGNDEGKKF